MARRRVQTYASTWTLDTTDSRVPAISAGAGSSATLVLTLSRLAVL